MLSGMRTGYPRGLNKRLGTKFRDCSRLRQEGSRLRQEGSRVRKKVPESEMVPESEKVPESDKKYPKKAGGNKEDEYNSPNIADNTNHQTSSQTFREILPSSVLNLFICILI